MIKGLRLLNIAHSKLMFRRDTMVDYSRASFILLLVIAGFIVGPKIIEWIGMALWSVFCFFGLTFEAAGELLFPRQTHYSFDELKPTMVRGVITPEEADDKFMGRRFDDDSELKLQNCTSGFVIIPNKHYYRINTLDEKGNTVSIEPHGKVLFSYTDGKPFVATYEAQRSCVRTVFGKEKHSRAEKCNVTAVWVPRGDIHKYVMF